MTSPSCSSEYCYYWWWRRRRDERDPLLLDILPHTPLNSTPLRQSPSKWRSPSVRRRRRPAFREATTLRSHHHPNFCAILLLLLLVPFATTTPTTPTTPSPKYSVEERHLLRSLFLRKFGLEHLEGPIAASAEGGRGEASSRRMPAYLWELYEQAREERLETVRHYLPVNVKRLVGSERRRVLLTYNLSTTDRRPEHEMILRADLRLPSPRSSSSSRRRRSDRAPPPYKVDLYEQEGALLLDSRTTLTDGAKNGDSWIDLSATLAFWERPAAKEATVTFLLDFSHSPSLSLKRLRESALIIYSESVEVGDGGEGNVRKRRSVPNVLRKKHRKHHRKHHVGTSPSPPPSQRPQQQHPSLCRRTGMYVAFSELNWQDWIIAPAGYEAYQCRGRCPHPIPAYLNTTNHAIIQSLLHSIDPTAVPAPCCVPTETSPLAIIYRDASNAVVVKTYPDMKVEGCGCH